MLALSLSLAVELAAAKARSRIVDRISKVLLIAPSATFSIAEPVWVLAAAWSKAPIRIPILVPMA